MDGHCYSGFEQWRLDRVVIAAAVRALYGPAARVRSISPVSGNRRMDWVRQGRLELLRSNRASTLPAVGPAFQRGRS
jgi:hypothetical protein